MYVTTFHLLFVRMTKKAVKKGLYFSLLTTTFCMYYYLLILYYLFIDWFGVLLLICFPHQQSFWEGFWSVGGICPVKNQFLPTLPRSNAGLAELWRKG